MRKSVAIVVALYCFPVAADVVRFASLTSAETRRLDRDRTALVVPGMILEEHGPYLPNGADGVFNQRLADDLAAAIARQPGWTAVLLPAIPLGSGAANEIGGRYSFPGSATVRPSTLRSVFMDLADQFGPQGFRWVFLVHGHGDPAHHRMLDDAGDYFHDTYGGAMVNVFGYVWAMPPREFRTAAERAQDGLAEHATMTETSVLLALQPHSVAAGFRSATPLSGQTMADLQRIASAPAWPGYFGAPALATPELGAKIYGLWLERAEELVRTVLAGGSLASLPRYGTVFADDPADAAAAAHDAEAERRQAAWLARRKPAPAPPR